MTDFNQEKYYAQLNMLAIKLNFAKSHCLYSQGAVAFETPGLLFGLARNKVKSYMLQTSKLFHESPNQF